MLLTSKGGRHLFFRRKTILVCSLIFQDSWVGRAFDEYMHKKDLITFNSVHGGSKIQDSEDEDMEGE